MSWEFLRDIGLATFASGALVVLALRRMVTRRLGSKNAGFVAVVGDAMMLAGASLAVTAMAVGYLASMVGSP